MNIQEYKCPCCGGAIEFDSTVQKMKCPYCDTEFDVEAMKAYDEALKKTSEDEIDWKQPENSQWQESETERMQVYVCKSCGGEIVVDENTAATNCPYCDNPVVLMGKFSGDLKPDYVIPFQLNKEAAKEGLRSHLKGKRLLPKVFKDENHIDEIKGIYVPFWLFDANVESDVRLKATKVRKWSDSNYLYTQTSYFSLYRNGDADFERVPVDGSSQMPNDLMESIEPFDFSKAVDFQTAYLAGYLADRYDVTAGDSVGIANERIKNSITQMLLSQVHGYATVFPEQNHVRFHGNACKYALYPVWILNTSWKGQKYTFAMNGQTGKFVGDLPVDNGAYFRWLAGLTVGISAAVYLILFLFNLLFGPLGI